jgi:hypothetical protein
MIYLNPASTASVVVLPCSFSSRLIRVAAAERPMKTAKRGSPTLDIRWAGDGIVASYEQRYGGKVLEWRDDGFSMSVDEALLNGNSGLDIT